VEKSHKPSSLLREFLGKFRTFNDPAQLRLLACTLELFRQASTPKKDPAFFRALALLAQKAGDINWGAVPFSITHASLNRGLDVAVQYGATRETAPAMVSAALVLFSDLIENGLAASDVPAQDIFDAVIAEVAESPNNPLLVSPTAPEIYNERMLSRVFQPAQFTEQTAASLEASLVVFRDKLPNGDRGPSLRGISFDNGSNTHNIILETGEFVRRKKGDESVVGTNTADDYLAVCPALLAYVRAAVKELTAIAVLEPAEGALVEHSNCFGEFTKTVFPVVATREMVASLTTVIDDALEATSMGIIGATGPTGATIQFPVPGTDYAVVLDAVTSTVGPYVVAKLVQNGTIIMRLEQPRQFSALGVYLFPLTNCVVSLTVIY
jgi:hypothetical protein